MGLEITKTLDTFVSYTILFPFYSNEDVYLCLFIEVESSFSEILNNRLMPSV